MARQTAKRIAAPRGAPKKADRRNVILDAALDEFSVRGFEATRMDDVARRAGVAKGTVYLYFRDKEALFQDLVRTMLTPIVGTVEAMRDADVPLRELSERMIDLFVDEIFATRRRDVIRLMLIEGRRFPKLAEFYYREVLSRAFAAMRALLAKPIARGEVPATLATFPHLLAAPGIVAVMWTGLFDKFDPLDVRAMMRAHVDILFQLRS